MKRIFTLIAVTAAFAAAFTACTDTEEVGTQDGDGLFLNHYTLDLNKGETYNLVGTVTPKNAPALSYSSSDAAIATVDEKGLVSAVGAGEAVITAKSASFTRECTVKVWSAASSIVLSAKELEMAKGEAVEMTATIGPDDINVPYSVSWSVSDPVVSIEVDPEDATKATVKAIAGGSAVITVKAGDATVTCPVTVDVKLLGIHVTPASATIEAGQEIQLTVVKEPEDAVTEIAPVWSSSDESVVKVDANGLVTGMGNGEADITVSAAGFEAHATITVAGGVLISKAANLTDNYFKVNWKNDVSSLDAVTVEWWMRGDKWVTNQNNSVNSVFGIEGQWLLRIGDVGIGQNQLQLATNHGNNTPQVKFDANTWYHVAVVYETASRNVYYYVNGELAATGTGFATRNVNLGAGDGCYISRSYDNSRSFCGALTEMRVWKVARSAEDIKSNMYTWRGSMDNLLAYWKFNEGQGNKVADASGHGNDITSNGTLKWEDVEIGGGSSSSEPKTVDFTPTEKKTTLEDVTLEFNDNCSYSSYGASYGFEVYKGGAFTVSVPSGKKITAVEFKHAYQPCDMTASTGTYKRTSGTSQWNGEAQSVTFTNNANSETDIPTVSVTYE